MGRLIINQEKIGNINEVITICPFGAMENHEGKLEINEACRMCKLCVKKGPEGAISYLEEEIKGIDKSLWQGIAVYVDHEQEEIHPVTLELLGKARELAAKVNQKVYGVFVGKDISEKAKELLHYGVDEVFVYDHEAFENFRIEPYAKALQDFIACVKPAAVLVGATTIGRSLAPRIAASFKTGLTADCTILDMKENTDLVQIRPAFGGNIMAQIITPNSRPQLATVRYKVMEAPERSEEAVGEIVERSLPAEELSSGINVLKVALKEKEQSLTEADVIIAVGRAIKSQKDMAMVYELAELLGAQIGGTRPLMEAGIIDAKRQIGLSGRTVRPSLIITLGISGAVQFTAGMKGAKYIFAINKDSKAPIFKLAHYGIVGDIYEIVPRLIEEIKAGKELIHV